MSGSRIRVGVSSCLLGEQVRYDGGHKRDRYLTDTLARHFEFVPFCPEVGAGLGVPRPALRLSGDPRAPRAVGVRDASLDATERISDYARSVLPQISELSGYLFKRASPSCGLERVKVYSPSGQPSGSSGGIYARRVREALPWLPCEEEGRLNDPHLRESFVERVYVYHRWRRLAAEGLSAGKLVEFHTRHKLLLLSHSEVHYRRLGRLVAEAGRAHPREVGERYIALLLEGLGRRGTRRRHANVLQHLLGFFKRVLDAGDKAEFLRTVDEYRAGQIPLAVPLRLLEHHLRRHPDGYLEAQYYLDPYPPELGLRSHL